MAALGESGSDQEVVCYAVNYSCGKTHQETDSTQDSSGYRLCGRKESNASKVASNWSESSLAPDVSFHREGLSGSGARLE